MRFVFCAVTVLTFFGLVITPSIGEVHGQFWWSQNSWLDPKKQPAAQPAKTKVLVKWGYSYPCPLVFCDAYVESIFKEIPKSGIYTKTGKINGRYDWI